MSGIVSPDSGACLSVSKTSFEGSVVVLILCMQNQVLWLGGGIPGILSCYVNTTMLCVLMQSYLSCSLEFTRCTVLKG